MMQERFAEFDIAKGIAAYLVVLGHLLNQVAELDVMLITFCHMPVFFWISGFFLHKSLTYTFGGGYYQFIIKKIQRLLIPYIIWSAISFAANIALRIFQGTLTLEYVAAEFVNIFIYARSVWFLVVMFFSEMICVLIWRFTCKNRITRYLLLVSTWLIICIFPLKELLSIWRFKWLFPFLVLGMMCAERAASGKILGNIRHKWISFLFIPMAVMLFQEEPFAEYISCSYSNVENLCFGILYYAVSAVSIGLVLYISELISARKVGRYIAMAGRYSLEIYVMHMFAVKFIPIVPSLILENSVYEYLYFGCYGFVVTVLIVLFSENVLERYKLGRWMMGINGTACGK